MFKNFIEGIVLVYDQDGAFTPKILFEQFQKTLIFLWNKFGHDKHVKWKVKVGRHQDPTGGFGPGRDSRGDEAVEQVVQ